MHVAGMPIFSSANERVLTTRSVLKIGLHYEKFTSNLYAHTLPKRVKKKTRRPHYEALFASGSQCLKYTVYKVLNTSLGLHAGMVRVWVAGKTV